MKVKYIKLQIILTLLCTSYEVGFLDLNSSNTIISSISYELLSENIQDSSGNMNSNIDGTKNNDVIYNIDLTWDKLGLFGFLLSAYTSIVIFLIRLWYVTKIDRSTKERDKAYDTLKKIEESKNKEIYKAKNELEMYLANIHPEAITTFIHNREELQNRLNAIFLDIQYRPKRIYQTLFKNNPISSNSDFLNDIENRNCKIVRIMAITRASDIYFASHSYKLKSKFSGIKNFMYLEKGIRNVELPFPNYTIIDSHSIISLPSSSKKENKERRNRKGLLNEGETRGIYMENEYLNDGLSNYLDEIARSTDNRIINSSLDVLSDEIIEKAKKEFWEHDEDLKNSIISKAEYLTDVATVIKTELTYEEDVYNNVVYIGVVGSVATIKNQIEIDPNFIPLQAPNDLDLVIILRQMEKEHLEIIMDVIESVCDVYNSSILELVPIYSTSPAIISNNERQIPIQVLFQDMTTISERWQPYIYRDRLETNIQIDPEKSFPEIEKLMDFTFNDLLKGEDGINDCIKTIETGVSYGYEWRTKGNSIEKDDSVVELSTDIEKFNFLHYSLYWTVINLSRANDVEGFILHSFEASAIRKKLLEFDKSFNFLPSVEFFEYVLSKKYIDESTDGQYQIDIDQASRKILDFLNELIRVFDKNSTS